MSQLLEYPDLNVEQYIKKINELGYELKRTAPESKNPKLLISFLNEFMFQNNGFTSDEDDYFNPKNNFLNDVIDKKSGIPITLSILYTELAKHLGLELQIVGFPSHILVKMDEEIILDPFNGGRLVDMEQLDEILDRNYDGMVEFSPEFLDSITPEMVLIRMARNLKNSYSQSYAYQKALQCTDMVLAMEPDAPDEIRDKGILEERLGNSEEALKHLNQYLEMNPNGEDIDLILELIKSIRIKLNQ